MSKDLSELIKHTRNTTALLAGAIAICGFTSPLVGTVLGGILTNIVSNRLEQSKLLKLNQILSERNPANLNHNLEDLTEDALLWAVKNIFYKYEFYCITHEQKDLLSETKSSFLEDLEAIDRSTWQTSEDLLNQIDGLTENVSLIERLIDVDPNWPAISDLKPFPQFFKNQFIDNFRLCFGELLKRKDNQLALKAYNRNISTQIRVSLNDQSDKIDKLLEDNKELRLEIRKLSLTPIERLEQEIVLPEINISLDKYLKPLQESVALLVDQNGNILEGIKHLQKESEIQSQHIKILGEKVDRNLNSKYIFITLPILAIALAYFSFSYWQSTLPFFLTVSVNYISQSTELPIEEASISISYGDKTETLETHHYEAIFKDLPSYIRGDSIAIKISSPGFSSLDTIISGSAFKVSLTRDLTYASMKGRVKDFATGAPISQAKVIVKDLMTSTDENGYYELIIPESQQKIEQRLIISHQGYRTWERIEPVIENVESIIQLEHL